MKITNASSLKLHTNESLKALLVDVMNEYARRFCKMYDYGEGWWVVNDPCGTYCTDDIVVSISASDLMYCVDEDVDKDVFESWWRYIIEIKDPNPITLHRWRNGVRPDIF